jgi:hypothetical protein
MGPYDTLSSIYVGPEELATIDRLSSHLHCPRCTGDMTSHGFASAYWQGEVVVYFCWCAACGWLGDIKEFTQMITSFERDETAGSDRSRLEPVE